VLQSHILQNYLFPLESDLYRIWELLPLYQEIRATLHHTELSSSVVPDRSFVLEESEHCYMRRWLWTCVPVSPFECFYLHTAILEWLPFSTGYRSSLPEKKLASGRQ
jgi:hypothetical protein